MLDKQDVKLGLEKEKFEDAKMAAQAGIMMVMNESSHITLANITQRSKDLDSSHGSIGNAVLAAQTSAALAHGAGNNVAMEEHR
jgi:hypothetical protein